MLGELTLSSTVLTALDDAAGRCEPGRPLQTGIVLAALIEADAYGAWDGVWPSYDGAAESLLTSDDDENAQASGGKWRQADLSADLRAALDLLADTARRYAMDPVPPGALALALASVEPGSASRHMSRLSGRTVAELTERIQSDLLGTFLEGYTGAPQPEAGPVYSRPAGPLIVAGLAAGAACVFAAWQALRLIIGPAGGAVLALGVLTALLGAARESRVGAAAQEPESIRPWRLANYRSPLDLAGLLIVGGFLVYVVVNRHHASALFPIGVTFGVLALALIVLIGGHSSPARRSGGSRGKRRYIWFPADTRYQRIPVACAIITGALVTLADGLVQFNSQHYTLAPTANIVVRWLTATAFGSALGGWLPLWYWSIFVALAAAAVPQSPLTYPGIKGPSYTVPRKFPTYPNAITFNNALSFSALQWTRVSRTEAVATGYVQVDDCLPSCAEGTLHGIPVVVTFADPRLCPIESVYVHMTADVFTQVQVRLLVGSLPPYLASRYAIPGACT